MQETNMVCTKDQFDRFRSLFAGVDVGTGIAIDRDNFLEFWGLGWLQQSQISPLQCVLTQRGRQQLDDGLD
jgi:hypothetical protein